MTLVTPVSYAQYYAHPVHRLVVTYFYIPIPSPHKFFSHNNLSHSISAAMPLAKLFILFVILVRDQEVGGSNPLAPTKSFNNLHIKLPRKSGRRFSRQSLKRYVLDSVPPL